MKFSQIFTLLFSTFKIDLVIIFYKTIVNNIVAKNIKHCLKLTDINFYLYINTSSFALIFIS